MARSFNGTSDLVIADGANVASMSAPFSVSAWLKCASSVTNSDYYGEGLSSGTNPFLQLQCNSGKWRIFLRRNSNGFTSDVNGVSTLTVADGTWHHVLYAQDGSGNWQTYIDGVADSTAKGTYTTQVMTVDLVTFAALRRQGSLANRWAGTLMEVATWTRQLAVGDAKSLASGLPASHLGPTHYWPLWGRDSPEPDIGIGTHVTGTLTGTSFASGGKVGKEFLVL